MPDILCSMKTTTILSKLNEREMKTENSMKIKKEIKKHHNKHKNQKRLMRFRSLNDDKIEENIKENLNNSNNNQSLKSSDSLTYVSWFIFVPLVFLIFVMTILSVAGFLILILNSNNQDLKHTHIQITQPNGAEKMRRNLTNSEILELLKYKQMKNKKKEAKMSNFKPADQPEGAVIKF